MGKINGQIIAENIDSTPFDFHKFANDEPNGNIYRENCVIYYPRSLSTTYESYKGFWADELCMDGNAATGYICKKQAKDCL